MNYGMYILALFSISFELHQSIYGMNFAHTMSKLTTSTFFATVCGYAGLRHYASKKYVENLPDADLKAAEFVQETLQKHGYAESFYKNIKFKKRDKFGCFYTTMAVPFSEYDIKYENDMLVKSGLTSHPSKFLSLWQGSILHEAGHMSHYDTHTRELAPFVCSLAVHYSGKKISNFLRLNISFLCNPIARGLATIPCLVFKLATTAGLVHAFAKYQEYRADCNVIKCATDPEILESRAQRFYEDYISSKNDDLIELQRLKELKDTCRFDKREYEKLSRKIELYEKHPWLKELWNIHPRAEVRSAYFAQAAQNLRKKSNFPLVNSTK